MPTHRHEDAGASASNRQFISDRLNEWDFIGVADLLEFNQDEYDCLVLPLLKRLQAGHSVVRLTAYLNRQLAGHFGLNGPANNTGWFAARLHAAWLERTR